MDTPPKQVNITLEDTDVHRDMDSIISSMDKIRAEAKADKQISDQQMDEYLHLAYRLASGIKSVAGEKLLPKMQKVASRMDANPMLMRYDPMQDGIWKKEEKEFVASLDDILIAVEGDNFRSSEERHHILQAIKYLAAGESFEEKERIYNSIIPFEGGILSDNKETAKDKLINFFFGSSFRSETVDPLTLRVDANLKFLEEIKAKASERGYRYLRIAIPEEEVAQFKDENRGIKVIGKVEKKKSEIDSENKTRKIVKNALCATMPLSYPILGALGQSRVERIVEYAYADSNGQSQEKHTGGMLISSLGANALGGIAMIIKGFHDNSWAEGFFGVYMVAEQIVRVKEASEYEGNNLIPTIPGAIFNEVYNLFTGKKDRKGNQIEVEINLEDKAKMQPSDITPALQYLEKMALVEVPEEIAGNLIFGPGNNRYFGRKFIGYLEEKAGKTKDSFTMDVDKKNEAVVYSKWSAAGDYIKTHELVCIGNQKYLVNIITPDNINPQEQGVIEALKTSRDLKEASEKILSKDGVKYLRIRKYEGSKLTAEQATH